MAHTVFISYSSKDKPVADAACAALEAQRIPCWIAPRDILAGDEYGDAIIDAISACQIVVVIFSLHANDSPQVRREVERAVAKGKIIVPYRIEDVLPTHAMEFALSNTHWLDALTPPLEHRLTELCETVSRIIQRHTVVEPLWQQTEPAAAPGGLAAALQKETEVPQAIVVELPSAAEEQRVHEATAPVVPSEFEAKPEAVVPARLPVERTAAANGGAAVAAERTPPPKKKIGRLILAGAAGLAVLLLVLLSRGGSKAPPAAVVTSAAAGSPAADALPAPAAVPGANLAAETAPKAAASVPEAGLTAAASRRRDLWLSQPLQGGDNEAAKARVVTIAQVSDGYVVSIANQFGFSCGLHFNEAGDPAKLTDCVSKGQPEWTAVEKEIPVSCGGPVHAVNCTGRYTLKNGDYASAAVLRFGYKS